MTENCNLIMAFFPETARTVAVETVERILRSHPIRITRIESTPKGVLVFAESTRCESFELTGMREALLQDGRSAGYRVRMHREGLFRAMHSLNF
ncbi:MAG: hypothetical protein WC314_15220 [Vulcanimicrobiota bacterium]